MALEYIDNLDEVKLDTNYPLVVVLFSTNRDYIYELFEYSNNNRVQGLRYLVVKSPLNRIEVFDGELHYMLKGKPIRSSKDITYIIEETYDLFIKEHDISAEDQEYIDDDFQEYIDQYDEIYSDEEN